MIRQCVKATEPRRTSGTASTFRCAVVTALCYTGGMPVPRAIAHFQRRFIHPVVRGLATWLPGYGLLLHVGRRSGRTYRVPLNVFDAPDGGFAVVLAYGTNSDWLLNLRSAGTAELIKKRRQYRVSNPRIVSGPDAVAALPFYGRLVSRLTRSPDVLLVDALR